LGSEPANTDEFCRAAPNSRLAVIPAASVVCVRRIDLMDD